MASRSEIKKRINNTRSHITYMVDEISDKVHKNIDWKEKVRERPTETILIAAAAGFVLATFSSSLTRSIIRFGIKSALAAVGAYASKQGIDYLTNKIKSE